VLWSPICRNGSANESWPTACIGVDIPAGNLGVSDKINALYPRAGQELIAATPDRQFMVMSGDEMAILHA
jgi:hypothetical protein